MIEARIGQIVILKTVNAKLEGVIDNVELDRIAINYFKYDAENFKKLKEGEVLHVFVHTKFGVKKMKSMVIDNQGSKLIIENAATIEETDKRQDVRTSVKMQISIETKWTHIKAAVQDLSAGGVRFRIEDEQNLLDKDQEIDVKLKDIALIAGGRESLKLKAKIIKVLPNGVFVAQFIDENENLKNKISSFCMNNMD